MCADSTPDQSAPDLAQPELAATNWPAPGLPKLGWPSLIVTKRTFALIRLTTLARLAVLRGAKPL